MRPSEAASVLLIPSVIDGDPPRVVRAEQRAVHRADALVVPQLTDQTYQSPSQVP